MRQSGGSFQLRAAQEQGKAFGWGPRGTVLQRRGRWGGHRQFQYKEQVDPAAAPGRRWGRAQERGDSRSTVLAAGNVHLSEAATSSARRVRDAAAHAAYKAQGKGGGRERSHEGQAFR